MKLWRAPVGTDMAETPTTGPLRMLAHAYAVTALNPKSTIFFVAFVSQFLDAARLFLPRVAILIATFITMAALSSLAYVLLASIARERLRQPRIQRAMNRTGGTLLIGAGAMAFGWRRAA